MKKWILPAGIVILATAAAITASVVNRVRSEVVSTKPFQADVADFKPEKVAKIRISFGDGLSAFLDRQQENWTFHSSQKPDVFANARLVAETLDELTHTRIIREFYPTEQEQRELSLSDFTTGKKGNGFDLELRDQDNKILLKMMLGRPHYKPEERLSDHYSVQEPDGRYVRITGPDGKYHYCLISRVFENCLPFASIWVEPLRISSFDTPDRIRFTKVGKSAETIWEITRSGQNFALTVPAGKKLNGRQIDLILKLLTGAFTRDVADKNAVFTPDSALTLSLVNGITYTLEMQDAADELQRYARMKIDFDPEKVMRKTGEPEKAHAERIKRLEHHVQMEREWFCKNIFMLQPDVIRMLSKIPQEEK